MISRKLAVLAAASLIFSTAPAAAQVGPNPTPPTTGTTPAPTTGTRTGDDDRGNSIFGSDLTFMLVAIGVAVLIAFLATQIEGDDAEQPVSP